MIKKIIKEEINDFDGGLEYIDSYYNEMKAKLDNIKSRMLKELPIIGEPKGENDTIRTIKYSDTESWGANPHISDTLTALAHKIEHMIDTGKSHSVKPMLRSIVSNNIKKLKKPTYTGGFESLGKGHFRWNFGKVYTLTSKEIQRVKEFFNL